MATAITLPKEYSYVLLTASTSVLVSIWHGVRTGPFRKAAQISYPQAFATPSDFEAAKGDAEKTKALHLFNCAQRAHLNFVENYAHFLVLLAVSGLQFPRASASLGGLFLLGRVLYAVGYTDGHPKGMGRMKGFPQYFGVLGLLGLAGKTVYDLVMA